MDTFYGFVRKFMSFCCVCIDTEEEELRERQKDELKIILDNSLSSDCDGRRVLVSHFPSDENGAPNEICWSSAEEMKGETYSYSWLACSTTSNANAATEPLESSKNRYILAETDSSPDFPGFKKAQLVSPKVTSVPHLSSVYSRYDTEIENDGLKNSQRNSSSRNKADVYYSIKEVTSGESLSACSLRNSLDSHCGTNYDGDDYIKEKLSSLRKTSTEPDSSPTKSKKASDRESKIAKQLSSLVNKNEKPTGETSMSPRSGRQGLNSIKSLRDNANAVSVANGQQLRRSKNGCILAETDSSPKQVSQKVTSSINFKPKDVKMWVVKEKSRCTNHLMSIQQSPDLLSSSKKSCSFNGSTNASLNKTTVSENCQSEEHESLCIENSVEEKNGSHEALGSDSFVQDDADSLKDIQTCLKSAITEPDSTPIKSKKKASKPKTTKNSLLNNQNGQLIVEASTSDPQSLNAVEQISNKVIAIGVPDGQLLGSTENGRILIELDTLRNELGSQKKSLPVPQKVTLDTVENKKEAKQWVPKEECSQKSSSLVNGSVNAACKKLAGHVQSEFGSATGEQESGYIQQHLEGNTNTSPKTRLVPKKLKEVQLWVPKDKPSSSDHPISTQQSQNLISTLKKPFLVNGSTYDDPLKKTTVVEFTIAPEEQKSLYIGNSFKGSNGSQAHKKVITSPTNAVVLVERKIQGYFGSHKILLVGEGNFSFSACLARAFDSATNMVATSLNSEEYLNRYYKGALGNLSELKRRGCKVLHDVDATTVANHSSIKGQSFDRIIYNFPHCGDFSLTKDALRKNQTLVRLFMENSSKMIEQDGEIHIRHKTTKSFSAWDLNGLASEAGLVLIEKAQFHFRKFKGYETKYGFEGGKFKFSSDDNFKCNPCRTYKFVVPQHEKEMGLKNSKQNA